MRDNLVEQIISDVMNKQTDISPEAKTAANFAGCGITEFVGTALGHTIGLVIANVDNQLHEVMNIDKKYRSIGILGARTGAGPQIFAADEAIKATNTMGDVYGSSAGHLEFQYTARASYALNKALGAPIGKSFGMTCASPAAIGLVIADAAAKSAVIDPVGYASPSQGTSFSNEVIFTFSGDSGAVRQAVIAAREVGLQLLSTLDPVEIKSTTTPYI